MKRTVEAKLSLVSLQSNRAPENQIEIDFVSPSEHGIPASSNLPRSLVINTHDAVQDQLSGIGLEEDDLAENEWPTSNWLDSHQVTVPYERLHA